MSGKYTAAIKIDYVLGFEFTIECQWADFKSYCYL